MPRPSNLNGIEKAYFDLLNSYSLCKVILNSKNPSIISIFSDRYIKTKIRDKLQNLKEIMLAIVSSQRHTYPIKIKDFEEHINDLDELIPHPAGATSKT